MSFLSQKKGKNEQKSRFHFRRKDQLSQFRVFEKKKKRQKLKNWSYVFFEEKRRKKMNRKVAFILGENTS